MRMMMKAQMDTAAASKAIESGRMPQVMQSMMEALKPELCRYRAEVYTLRKQLSHTTCILFETLLHCFSLLICHLFVILHTLREKLR